MRSVPHKCNLIDRKFGRCRQGIPTLFRMRNQFLGIVQSEQLSSDLKMLVKINYLNLYLRSMSNPFMSSSAIRVSEPRTCDWRFSYANFMESYSN